MSSTKHNRVSAAVGLVLAGCIIACAVFVVLNRQWVMDQLSVWSYRPSAGIQGIVHRVGLTQKGTFMFYASQPDLADQANFNQGCPRQEAGSPILGCYTSDGRIYIYNLSNSQLDGIEEVTAAHEMLHGVWQRLSESDRQHLSTLLQAAYAKTNDATLKDRMRYYERAEPGELTNELHSIMGTEVPNLGDELEKYYNQYFDRSAVLKLHATYSAVYTKLYNRSDQLYTSMQSLAASIQSDSDHYQADYTQLSTDISTFNTKADTPGAFGSTTEFYSERSALTNRSAALDARRVTINTNIDTYNKDYAEYESIASQIQVLNNSLDSFKSLDQAPSV